MEPLSESQIIKNLQQTEDPSAQYYAAWWLGKMRSRHPKAVPLLLATLRVFDDCSMDPDQRGVALNAIRALGLLGDDRAALPLQNLLRSKDYHVREEAARSLGAMGSRHAVDAIRALLVGGLEGAGREQPNSPLLQEPCEALLEALGDIGIRDAATVTAIHPFTKHPRPLIRSAACRALLQLTGEAHWGEELMQLLVHPEPLVRRGALLDLGATGWTTALGNIKAATVEPSLKLVALRGLAERSEDEQVLDVMDSLL
ncbi:MAG: HEAT repeat domain-containing protein [Synechococcus sp.]